jgi:hypothetical protein
MPIHGVMSSSFRRRVVIAVVLSWFIAGTAAALYAPDVIPEHADVRREYREFVDAPLIELARIRETTRTSRLSGTRVQVSVEENDRFVYLLFVPERGGAFPVDTAGTFVLRRDRTDGSISQLKIFLRDDERFFIRIRPAGAERSLMDVYLAGLPIHVNVPVPVPVTLIMEEPVERLLDATGALVDWQWFFPDIDPVAYRAVREIASRTRAALHTLPDAEDGAMDENGRLVYIDSLVLQDQEPGFNCSGFAKWIIDGLHMALYGSFLPIEPLKTRHLELRGHRWSEPVEELRDPYFGLDWTRNLATTMLAEEAGSPVHPEAADVRSVPFASYVEDVGFAVSRLPLIMYSLAVTEPGYFYIASLNREFGEAPRLNQHVHVAVLFPYFDEDGRFVVDVMERNVETSLESLDRRYHNDHIHLVRVRANESYTPPNIRN